MLNTHRVLDTVLSILHEFTHLMLALTLWVIPVIIPVLQMEKLRT